MIAAAEHSVCGKKAFGRSTRINQAQNSLIEPGDEGCGDEDG